MSYGVLSVWIREPDNCTVADVEGYVWARACCSYERSKMYKTKIKEGHAQFKVPPGCYIVDARVWPGCCGDAKETMVIVKCDETVCVNLLREYARDPIKSIISFVPHAREAKIPEKDIEKFVDIMEKIAGTVPKNKVRRYTEKELELVEEVSDKEHKAILKKYRSKLIKK